MKEMTKIDPLHRLYMLYCLNFVDSINPYKACYMFYWQDFDLLTSLSYLQGVLNRNMARFTTAVDMQDQKRNNPENFDTKL